MTERRGFRSIVGRMAASAMIVAMSAAPTYAQDDTAARLLKAMSTFMAGLPHITLTYDSDIEVLTSDMQKIQFASTGSLSLSRPAQLRSTRIGGYADVELFFDGTTLTLHDRAGKVYAQVPSPGNVDQLVDRLREEHGVSAPGLDFILSDPYTALTDDVHDARYIGPSMVAGVECDHLAFRTFDTDWQIWIEHGPRPFVRKYVITSKTLAAAPQYTLRIASWSTEPPAAGTFAYRPAADTRKVDVRDIQHTDEVPPGTVMGEKK